ncbi:PP2C family protein-serine/threonine phosphatase [Actinoplanes sp. RD1]|uniref:PP2C family protein-serine/threonine phosphatase n=1 Tax=Actinoplanes sp. RD1 TaxID=3064538 RepID=UPI00274117B2|nr:PP2C family protein-serine/threonine phosphatase [Actinoplanes sp. RD1]
MLETNRVLRQLIQPSDAAADLGGIRFGARCLSTDTRLRIGGDWYLSLRRPDGDVIIAVGDVAGHGRNAAIMMIPLRFAAAAYAEQAAQASPAALLASLNTMLCAGGRPAATAVMARYRPATGEITWARAGHPPMLLAAADGTVGPLPNPPGPLLGVFPRARYTEYTRSFPVGDRVVMYTDGIIRRGRHIDDEIQALAARIARTDRTRPLLDQLAVRSDHDDICVLVAERTE